MSNDDQIYWNGGLVEAGHHHMYFSTQHTNATDYFDVMSCIKIFI